jgi:hypothetical protein
MSFAQLPSKIVCRHGFGIKAMAGLQQNMACYQDQQDLAQTGKLREGGKGGAPMKFNVLLDARFGQ